MKEVTIVATSKGFIDHILDDTLAIFDGFINHLLSLLFVPGILKTLNLLSFSFSFWLLTLFVALPKEVDLFGLLPTGVRLDSLQFIEFELGIVK